MNFRLISAIPSPMTHSAGLFHPATEATHAKGEVVPPDGRLFHFATPRAEVFAQQFPELSIRLRPVLRSEMIKAFMR
jgi:hypothetical protein